jgi:hypothetical protein
MVTLGRPEGANQSVWVVIQEQRGANTVENMTEQGTAT